MNDSEVADISARVHILALRAYRAAVGRRTREIVRNLQPAEVEERVDATRIRALLSAGTLAEGAYGLAEYWGGKRKTALLAIPATRRSLTHLNQARLVRKKLGQRIGVVNALPLLHPVNVRSRSRGLLIPCQGERKMVRTPALIRTRTSRGGLG